VSSGSSLVVLATKVLSRILDNCVGVLQVLRLVRPSLRTFV
jgi:hypothetical protein